MNDTINTCRIDGKVLLHGADIYAKKTDVNLLRRRVGMVFQKPNPFPLSVYDNIAYGPRTHGRRKKRELDQIVEQALRSAAIWDEVKDKLKKSALALSGGQQQRVLLTRALCATRKILLLDEPVSGLDPVATADMYQIINELNKEDQVTIIMISHDISEVATYASHVLHIGQKVFFGTKEEYLESKIGKRLVDAGEEGKA